MSKKLLFIALAAAAMTACTSEDVVMPDGGNAAADSTPITFAGSRSNMSRVDPPAGAGLETVNYDFGVWAYKAAADANWTHTTAEDSSTGEKVVMHNYMVGYYDSNGPYGYAPVNASQNMFGSKWYYENLTSSYDLDTYYKGGVQAVGQKSDNSAQYLKYWDLSYTYVDFYACSPYKAATSFTASTRTMKFSRITDGDDADQMYGATAFESAAGVAGNKVNIAFKRLTSQVRLAFFSELTGYDVEIIDFNSSNAGLLMLPAEYDSTQAEGSQYSAGTYVNAGVPVVVWSDAGVDAVTITAPERVGTNFTWPLSFTKLDTSTTPATYVAASATLGTDYASRIFTGKRRVIPHGENVGVDGYVKNCGFTLNVSFKLTAQDTHEVIYVYGAKVFVSSDYTAWKANKLYTYIFKITDTLPGTTAGPVEPGVTPSSESLFPIVFDNLSVEELTEVELPAAGGSFVF